MLNVDQKLVFDRVGAHLIHQQKHESYSCNCDVQLTPLRMFLSGVGDTGKSFLIDHSSTGTALVAVC